MNNTTITTTVEAPDTEVGEVIKKPRFRPPVIATPRESDVTGHKPIRVTLPLAKTCFSHVDIPAVDGRSRAERVYNVYPRLSDWIGRLLPDGVNPRSHDSDCLKSDVAKGIEKTIIEAPEDFYLANRGSTIMVRSLEYDAKKELLHLTITNPELQGVADGATTDAVISKVQTRIARELLKDIKKDATYTDLIESIKSQEEFDSLVPDILKKARIHLEVHTDLEDRDRIAALVGGRNTSRQVKSWSMADFTGQFEWLKKIIDNTPEFAGKVGWEENSGKDITVLDVLAVLTLFHPEFDEQDANGDKAPTVAYSNKGKMDARLADPDLQKGYTKLAPLVPDILKLYEFTYSTFEDMFDRASGGKGRLGGRQGIKPFHDNPIVLPFMGFKSNYQIADGYLFPLLAAMRALISYEPKIHWTVEPFEFMRKHGPKLINELFEQVKGQGGNPNVAGKKKLVYTALHAKTQIAVAKIK